MELIKTMKKPISEFILFTLKFSTWMASFGVTKRFVWWEGNLV